MNIQHKQLLANLYMHQQNTGLLHTNKTLMGRLYYNLQHLKHSCEYMQVLQMVKNYYF